MNTELEKLREQQAKDLKALEQLQHAQQRLRNRIAYLEKGERQKRAHRLITKGAAIECLAPSTKEMGEFVYQANPAFITFMRPKSLFSL